MTWWVKTAQKRFTYRQMLFKWQYNGINPWHGKTKFGLFTMFVKESLQRQHRNSTHHSFQCLVCHILRQTSRIQSLSILAPSCLYWSGCFGLSSYRGWHCGRHCGQCSVWPHSLLDAWNGGRDFQTHVENQRTFQRSRRDVDIRKQKWRGFLLRTSPTIPQC